MSIIEGHCLIGLSARRAPGKPRFISPAPRGYRDQAARPQLVLGNARLPSSVRSPSCGLTGYYGHGATAAIADAYRAIAGEFERYPAAASNSLNFVHARFTVDVRRSAQRQQLSHLADAEMVDLTTCQAQARDYLVALASARIWSVHRTQVAPTPLAVSAYADDLCAAARQLCPRLRALVYSVPDGTPRGLKVVTVFTERGTAGLQVSGNDDAGIEVALH